MNNYPLITKIIGNIEWKISESDIEKLPIQINVKIGKLVIKTLRISIFKKNMEIAYEFAKIVLVGNNEAYLQGELYIEFRNLKMEILEDYKKFANEWRNSK